MIYILAPSAQDAIRHVRQELEPEFERSLKRNEYIILTPITAHRAMMGRRFTAEDIVIELKGWQNDSDDSMKLAAAYRYMLAAAGPDIIRTLQIRWR